MRIVAEELLAWQDVLQCLRLLLQCLCVLLLLSLLLFARLKADHTCHALCIGFRLCFGYYIHGIYGLC